MEYRYNRWDELAWNKFSRLNCNTHKYHIVNMWFCCLVTLPFDLGRYICTWQAQFIFTELSHITWYYHLCAHWISPVLCVCVCPANPNHSFVDLNLKIWISPINRYFDLNQFEIRQANWPNQTDYTNRRQRSRIYARCIISSTTTVR